jgi:hypothetical protein
LFAKEEWHIRSLSLSAARHVRLISSELCYHRASVIEIVSISASIGPQLAGLKYIPVFFLSYSLFVVSVDSFAFGFG